MASGSFSKNYMDEESDLDFLIVSAPRTVWITRTLLALYKRIFLANSHKYFCTNYLLDENHLEIEEQNLFTATELATLIPLYNGSLYNKLIHSNTWLLQFFPNFSQRPYIGPVSRRRGTKRVMEALMWPIKMPMEKLLQWIHSSRLKAMYQKQYSCEDFEIAFKATKGVSKSHPRNFQKVVLTRYYEKLNDHLYQS